MPLTRRVIILMLLVAGGFSCITPYDPEIDIRDIYKYVISGQVTDATEYQTVSVSRSSSVSEPFFFPVNDCSIRIIDDRGNIFPAWQSAYNGSYSAHISRSFLIPGASFKVEIRTPEGTLIESDFDMMNACPEVDSVYFARKDLVSFAGDVTKGIQFYINLDGGNVRSRNFRWELFETWEYHAAYPREWYYDRQGVHHIVPPDFSRKVCWTTELIRNIYTLSTGNLSENRYERFPLHFVNNLTSRLAYGYSLLVNQYSLSEAAFTYWDQLRINSSDQGGLYEKQPLSITGNLHNITDPDQEVLGFFGASSVRSKRIFVATAGDMELNFETFCTPAVLEKGFIEIDPVDYPAFLMGNDETFYMIYLSNNCVDCRTMGGTNIKPVFWPK